MQLAFEAVFAMGVGSGDVKFIQCKFCGVSISCMILFGDKKGSEGSDLGGKLKADTTGTSEKVVVVLKMGLHCDKCASKVRKAIRRFSG